MRGTALSVVRSMVKSECSKSLQTTSTAQDVEINQTIYNIQGLLAGTYDWPFLKTRWDVSVPPSQRYTAFPTTSGLGVTVNPDFERPVECSIKWNQIWQPVVYGIDEYPEFNYLDSDRSQILDPVQRWQFSDEGNFEVWPLPATTAQIRFVGQRMLTELRVLPLGNPITWNDAATLDLDDWLVAFYTAADYLTRQQQANAVLEAQKATKRLADVRAAYPTRTMSCIVGRGNPFGRKYMRQIPIVMVGGSVSPGTGGNGSIGGAGGGAIGSG